MARQPREPGAPGPKVATPVENTEPAREVSAEEAQWTTKLNELKELGMLNDAVLLRVEAFAGKAPWECLRDAVKVNDKVVDGIPDSLSTAAKERGHAIGILETAMEGRNYGPWQIRAGKDMLEVMLDQNTAEQFVYWGGVSFEVNHGDHFRVHQYDIDKEDGVQEVERSDSFHKKKVRTVKTVTPKLKEQSESQRLVAAVLCVLNEGLPSTEVRESKIQSPARYADEDKLLARTFPATFFRRDFLTYLRTLAADPEMSRAVFRIPFSAGAVDTFAISIHNQFDRWAVMLVPLNGVFYPEILTSVHRRAARLPQERAQAVITEFRESQAERQAEQRATQAAARERQAAERAAAQQREQSYQNKIAAERQAHQQQEQNDLAQAIPGLRYRLVELSVERGRAEAAAQIDSRTFWKKLWRSTDLPRQQAAERLAVLDNERTSILDRLKRAKELGLLKFSTTEQLEEDAVEDAHHGRLRLKQ